MDAAQACDHLGKNIVPQMQELGFEAFLLIGYLRDGEDKVQRVQLLAPGPNPAYHDGLRHMAALADKWGKGEL